MKKGSDMRLTSKFSFIVQAEWNANKNTSRKKSANTSPIMTNNMNKTNNFENISVPLRKWHRKKEREHNYLYSIQSMLGF